MLKFIRVNTKTKKIVIEEHKEQTVLFGGRGLIAKIMNEEVPAKCDPLGSENKLIIASGMLAGTALPCTNRLSVGAKSPLTKTIKEANVGGNAGVMLGRHGIKTIIFEDKPEDNSWYILMINSDGTPELIAADKYVGINNYALVEKLYAEYGDTISVISIGAAGERGYCNSSIQVTEHTSKHPSRAAARGGLGAVMGTKQIKAIVINKSTVNNAFDMVDKDSYNALRLKFTECITGNPIMEMGKYGTVSSIDGNAAGGILPVKNFSGQLLDNAEPIGITSFLTKIHTNGGKVNTPCQPGCVISCSNIYKNSAGEILTSGFEYESLGMLGPNCLISDLDAIAKMDGLCDDLGIDTIETGATIALCMEAGKIPWGDAAAAIGLIQEMFDGTELGRLMGQGTEAAGKVLGVKRIPVAKGQALAAYDPRNIKGTGFTFATSTQGADHTAGAAMSPEMDGKVKVGQKDLSLYMQNAAGVYDNLMCMFSWYAFGYDPGTLDVLVKVLAAMYGGEWTVERLMGLGYETLRMEKEFNKAAGFTGKDNRLPEFFSTEQTSFGAVFDFTDDELEIVG